MLERVVSLPETSRKPTLRSLAELGHEPFIEPITVARGFAGVCSTLGPTPMARVGSAKA